MSYRLAIHALNHHHSHLHALQIWPTVFYLNILNIVYSLHVCLQCRIEIAENVIQIGLVKKEAVSMDLKIQCQQKKMMKWLCQPTT